jgi:hypothetical protein
MHLRDLAPVRRVLRFAGAALLAAVVVAPAYAQALDAPTIQKTGGGFFRIDLDITAGASGAPNGFVVQWMKKADYEDYGFPADEYDALAASCDFTGEPTLNMDSRSSSFRLASGGVIGIQMGDLFDETGTYGTYLDGVVPGEYAFRVWAEGDGVNPSSASLPSEVQFFSTVGNPECTQGFWKNHPEVWPAGCTPMLLGTVAYTAAELLAIYNQPANGNGLVSLAHQLITAKLNGCNGSNLAPVAGTIAAADAAIGSLVIPPIGAGYLAPATTAAWTQNLDDYNNGIIPGVVACVTPARKSTWGAVKKIYR